MCDLPSSAAIVFHRTDYSKQIQGGFQSCSVSTFLPEVFDLQVFRTWDRTLPGEAGSCRIENTGERQGAGARRKDRILHPVTQAAGSQDR